MRQYRMTIRGVSPLLMSQDNIPWADEMKIWQRDPVNKGASVAGDDRTPAWAWLGRLYHDGKVISMPSDNLMRALMEGGAMVIVSGQKTYKAQTQSGMLVHEEFWPIKVDGKTIEVAGLLKLHGVREFEEHQREAAARGFYLYVKRAKVGATKHVRVRPRFDRWEASGTIDVWDEQITEKVLGQIATMAGTYKGLGDWRPGAPKTPGPYGRFSVEISKA